MLVIKTYLANSRIPKAGFGVFADETVKKGSPVLKFNPLIDIILTKDQMDNLPDVAREFIEDYAISWPYGAENWCQSLDRSNYINHSSTPNIIKSNDPNIDIAAVDINIGDELTVNYYSEDHRTERWETGEDDR